VVGFGRRRNVNPAKLSQHQKKFVGSADALGPEMHVFERDKKS